MRYATAAAFRAALEERLNTNARAGGRPVGRTRKLVAFTRLLARLERSAPHQWILKGGFALELRLSGQARATRDVDLDWPSSLEDATEALLSAAAVDLEDYFEFEIERVGDADVGAGGGVRFRADARVAGRLFEQLLIDIGVDGDGDRPTDNLTAPDLLDFAEIEPAHIRAIPLEQHIAEKLHAYTRRYGDDQPSSRVKDLIDIVLISELSPFELDTLREAIVRLFDLRATHSLPASVPAPPRDWATPYRALAEELGLDPDPTVGHRLSATFLDPVLAREPGPMHWSPEELQWQDA